MTSLYTIIYIHYIYTKWRHYGYGLLHFLANRKTELTAIIPASKRHKRISGHVASLRLCSHDAGTGRKRHGKVTFSLSVHTMPVRNCTVPSLLPSQNNAGLQTAWDENVTLCGIVWTPKTALFDTALVPSFLLWNFSTCLHSGIKSATQIQ